MGIKRDAMARKPPLEVVVGVRSRAVDDAAETTRDAAAAAARARDDAERAREDERAVRDAASARTRAEQDALASSASPRDLAQLAAFAHGLATKVAHGAARTAEAERRATEAAAREAEERARLVTAKGSLEVVEKHRARTRAADDALDQQQLDEAAEEAHAARRGRR
jgi:hypothetical protein